MNRQFNFRISDKLYTLLKQQAELEDRTQTDLVITAIKHYLEDHGTAANKTSVKLSLESQKPAPDPNSIEALLSSVNQTDSSNINRLLLDRLTASPEAQLQEVLSALAKRVSVLESYLIQQVEMISRSSSNPKLDRQQSQSQDLHLANLKEASILLDADSEHRFGTTLANEVPLHKESQVPKAQAISNGYSNSSPTEHIESSPVSTAVHEAEPSVASASLEEQPQCKTADDDSWITPQTAYEYAKARGYQRSFDAFRLSTTNKKDPAGFFAQFGLSYDPTRRVSRGITSKCFRFIQE
jgi:hypothetical protein